MVNRFSHALIAIALCMLRPAADAQHASPSSSVLPYVIGIWGTEQRLSDPVQGEVIVRGKNGRWTASIGGFEVTATRLGNDLRFTIPSKQGEFRGRFEEEPDVIRGEWIQPAGDVLSSYASPVVLHSLSEGSWGGIVAPLEQRFSVYASIAEETPGNLTATLANPEMNYFRDRSFRVILDGSKLHFVAKGLTFDGTLDTQSGLITIELPGITTPLQLSRRTRSDAVGLYPRVAESAKTYSYTVPIARHDGWQPASLTNEHIDPAQITKLVQRILDSDVAGNRLAIQSLLIARHGRLVLEEYFYGFDASRPHDMRSASKTFAPLLVGIARRQGSNVDPNSAVYPLFRKYAPFQNSDPRKDTMTLGNLMTMSAGNACDDNDDDSPGNEDRMQSSGQTDWYKYTLDLPMRANPGSEQAIYCSGDLNLVGGVVAASTGAWLPVYFDKYIARPLQFGDYYLNLMPDGQAYMGGGAYLRPRDEIKLGQLFLNGGVWNGQRILSESWVRDSIASHTSFDLKYSLGHRHEYGYGWHINFLEVGSKTYRAYSAGGNGGQFVIVVPQLALVIGINGGSYGEFDEWYRWEFELVPQYILAAVLDH